MARPAKPPDARHVRVSVSLPPAVNAWLVALGEGSLSKGIVEAARRCSATASPVVAAAEERATAAPASAQPMPVKEKPQTTGEKGAPMAGLCARCSRIGRAACDACRARA